MKAYFLEKEKIPDNFLIELQKEILENDGEKKIGALLSFVGVVRSTSHDPNKKVVGMEVETWEEMGNEKLNEIVLQVFENSGIHDVRLVHVYGTLNLGDPIVFIVIGSEHRNEAYQAMEKFIDAYKNKAPVWKKEIYADGSEQWIRTAH